MSIPSFQVSPVSQLRREVRLWGEVTLTPKLMNPELEYKLSSVVMKRLENKRQRNQQTRKSSWDARDKRGLLLFEDL